jgi:hypothetical protein
MSSTKLKTLRPMRPNVALLSMWKTFIHEAHEVENTTTDAAQCRFAFVVEGFHTTDAATCRCAFVVEGIHA